MRLNIGTKVVYRDTILATVQERLDGSQDMYRIRLHDYASVTDPHYQGTICKRDEIQPTEVSAG